MNRREFLAASTLAGLSTYYGSGAFAMPTAHLPTTFVPTPSLWLPTNVTATWLGQSTILINMFGTIILTDPVLFDSVGVRILGSTIGHTRLHKAPLSINDIPKPDIVALSHAHMDHTDLRSLDFLTSAYPNQIELICAKNTLDIVDDLAWKNAQELDWWSTQSCCGIEVTSVEVLHNGARFPWEQDRRNGNINNGRSYNGYLFQSKGESILFAGDTTHTQSFQELQNTNISLACVPVGAYQGYWENHCTPEQAVSMMHNIDARIIAPMHCMTFEQSDEPVHEPIHRFSRCLQDYNLPAAWTQQGETWTLL